MRNQLQNGVCFPDYTLIQHWLFGADTSSRLLNVLESPFTDNSPNFALSYVFKDAPFYISEYQFDGVIEPTSEGFRRRVGQDAHSHLLSCWDETESIIRDDMKLLCTVGDGIAFMRSAGLELLTGQLYLTPVSVSVVNIEGRSLVGKQERSNKHMAVHLVQPPQTVEQKNYFEQYASKLAAFLEFVSNPTADNRTDAITAESLFPEKILHFTEDDLRWLEMLEEVNEKGQRR